jgi:hypothetical protein
MHLVGYLYEDCHDARSLEHKANEMLVLIPISNKAFWYGKENVCQFIQAITIFKVCRRSNSF